MIRRVTISNIPRKLHEDGDLREGDHEPFECYEDDDTGYYQQACQLLLTALNRSIERENSLHDALTEYADHAEDSGWINLSQEIRRRARDAVEKGLTR